LDDKNDEALVNGSGTSTPPAYFIRPLKKCAKNRNTEQTRLTHLPAIRFPVPVRVPCSGSEVEQPQFMPKFE